MKRKLISILTVLAILLALTACSAGGNGNSGGAPASDPSSPQSSSPESVPSSQTSEKRSYEVKPAGVTFELPEDFGELKGKLLPVGGDEVAEGVYLAELIYFPMPEEKYDEILQKNRDGTITEEEVAFYMARNVDLVVVMAADGGRKLSDIGSIFENMKIPVDMCRQVGSAGDYNFFAVVNPLTAVLDDFDTAIVFDEGFGDEYKALVKAFEENDSLFILSEPDRSGEPQAPSKIEFETVDLDGNPVSSEDIFSRNKLTMINFWGTYCGPCINEMPDLEILNAHLQEKNCGIIGVVIDVPDIGNSSMVTAAKDILSDTGVTYLNVLPWSTLGQTIPLQFIPTTYFVDSEGRIRGEAAVGARGANDYEALIDQLLREE